MSREKVLEKLRKLRSLATSSNPHESDTAKKVADEFAKAHGITEEEVGRFESDLPIELPVGAGFGDLWKFSLLSVAAQFYGCEALQLNLGDRAKARLVGSPSNTKESLKLFNVLMTKLEEVERLVHYFGVTVLSEEESENRIYTPDEIAYSLRSGIVIRFIEELSDVYKKKKSRNNVTDQVLNGSEIVIFKEKKKKPSSSASYKPEVIKESISDVPSKMWMVIGYNVTADRQYYQSKKKEERRMIEYFLR